MQTNPSSRRIIAALFSVAILSTQITSRAGTIAGPYTADANTLHLWHMDSGTVPVPDLGSSGTNLVKLLNGATLNTNSYPGFGKALNTMDGGQTNKSTSPTGLDALLTAATNTATPGNVLINLADPTTGAFSLEAIVWIGFNPATNFGAAAVGGNGRNTQFQIIGAEGPDPSRSFQFKIAPIGVVTNAVVLAFNNLRANSASQTIIYALIPTNGPDAIVSNNWYHVAVTYNGIPNTANNFLFYWTLMDPTRTNASQISITTTNNQLSGLNPLSSATVPFMIGNEGRNRTGNFLGYIDEVRISSVARGSNDMMFSGPAPLVASQPTDQSVALGQPASFTARVTGLDPLAYQWRLYGTNVPGATTNTYSIASAQSTDAGPYDLVITNIYGAVTSSVATLTVGTPVTVTTNPVDLVVAVGQSAALSVTATGAPPLLYQWRQSGTNVAGATQTTYSLASAQLTNAGPYDVVVTNNFGSATSLVATLTVRVPSSLTWLGLAGPDWDTNSVSWTDGVGNVAYATGDNVTFDVNGSGQPSVNLTGPLSPSSVLVNAANDYTLSSSVGGGIVGSSRLTKSNTGTLVLDTDNSYVGPTVVSGGILQLGAADAHGTLGSGPITNNAAIVVNRTGSLSVPNSLAGSGSVTNMLAATVTVSGANTFSGPVVFNAGTLSLVGSQAIGNCTNIILNAQTVTSGGSTFLALSGGLTLGSNVTLSMLGTSDSPDFRCTVNNNTQTNVINGPIVLGGSGSVQFVPATGTEVDINSSISAPGFTGKLVFRGTGVGHIYGSINIPDANHLSTTDNATWVLHSTGNSWTNSNLAAGTFRMAANNALPAGLTLQIAGFLDLAGYNQQIGVLTDGGGSRTILNSSNSPDCVLTVSTPLASSFGGVIKDFSVSGGPGKLGLTIAGGGTLTLGGTNTYSGDTTISAGTLALTGGGTLNSTNGNIIIAAGATFDVSGVTSSPYHMRTHKTLIGGGVSGGATINGALFLNADSFLSLTYVSSTPAINVTGGELTLNANLTTVTVSGPALAVGSYKVISASGGGSVAGTLPASVTVAGSGQAPGTLASLRITDGELWLDIAPRHPVITSVTYDGTNLIFSGTNGTAGNTYYVQAATNLATPTIIWVPIFTNMFDTNGNFSVTNAVSPSVPSRFFRLQLQ